MSFDARHPLVIAIKKNLTKLGLTASSNVLVGVSGGMDSMVLMAVLNALGYKVSAAHINFNLRGNESDADALFVKAWCVERNIPYYEHSVNTTEFADKHKLNTQLAARTIRYTWWEYLVVEHKFDFVCTAHHLDDSIETLFMNLLRGSGLKGLTGIPMQRDCYVRPMIDSRKTVVEDFALAHSIQYRVDASNETDAYQRNRLRHHLLPVLEEIAPGFHAGMHHSLTRSKLEWEVWELAYQSWIDSFVKQQGAGYEIRNEDKHLAFQLRWLEEMGIPWSLANDYLSAPKADSGQVLHYDQLKLSRTNNGFFLKEESEEVHYEIFKPGQYSFGEFDFTITALEGDEMVTDKDSSTEVINATVVTWPLVIRSIQAGDHFQPLGMTGKSKKLQDFMVDQKMDMHQKEKLLVLTGTEQIIWVIGQRLDERAKIRDGEKAGYRLSFVSRQSD